MALEIFTLLGNVAINRADAIKDIRAVEKTADKSSTGMSKAFGRVGTALKVGVLGGIGAVVAGFTALAIDGTKRIAQVQDATRRFQADTGAAGEEVERFSTDLQALYRQNTDSVETLGNALTFVRQRFGDLGQETQRITQSFLDYAKVTDQDVQVAIADVDATLKVFGLTLADSGRLMDALLVAQQETGVEAGKLQRSINDSSEQFKALNIPLEEGIALIASFEERGVSATNVQRGLRNIIQRSVDPTDNQAKAMERLGVAVDETGKPIGGAEAAWDQLLRRLSRGIDTAEEMDAAVDLLGERAGVEMVRGLRGGEDAVGDLVRAMGESENAVGKASKAFDQQIGEAWTLLRRQVIDPVADAIGERVVGAIQGLIQAARENMPAIQAAVQKAMDGISQAVAFATENIFPSLIAVWTGMRDVFVALAPVISGVINTVIVPAVKLLGQAASIAAAAAETAIAAMRLDFNAAGASADKLGERISQFGEGVFFEVEETINPSLDSMAAKVEEVEQRAGGAIERTAEAIGRSAEDINREILGLASISELAGGRTEEAVEGVGVQVETSIGDMVDEYRKLGEVAVDEYDVLQNASREASKQQEKDVASILLGNRELAQSTKTVSMRVSDALDRINVFGVSVGETLTGAFGTVEQFFTQTIAGMVRFFDELAAGQAKITDAGASIKDFLLGFLTTLEIQVSAAAAAGIATAWAQAPITLGASLAAIGQITAVVGGTLALFETLKAGVRAIPFAAGGIVTQPTFAMIGEAGPEAVIPLSRANAMGAAAAGFGMANVVLEVDGERLAEVLGVPLTDSIRLRTGVRA